MRDKRIELADVSRFVQSGMQVGVGGGPLLSAPSALIREIIKTLDALDITADERKKIYSGNAKRLLRLK